MKEVTMTGLTNEQVQQRIEEGKSQCQRESQYQKLQADRKGECAYIFQLSEPCAYDYGTAGWFL